MFRERDRAFNHDIRLQCAMRMLFFLFADHEAELWEMEQRQLHERHQLAKSQLKETFFLQRSQMLNRHKKVSVATHTEGSLGL